MPKEARAKTEKTLSIESGSFVYIPRHEIATTWAVMNYHLLRTTENACPPSEIRCALLQAGVKWRSDIAVEQVLYIGALDRASMLYRMEVMDGES